MMLRTKVTFPLFSSKSTTVFALKKHPLTPKRVDSRGAEEGRSSTVEKWHRTSEEMKYIWSVQTETSVFIYLQSGDLTADLI